MVFSVDYWINAGGDDRRDDDDEPEPAGQLVTLEDLDEQAAEAGAGRKPMGRAVWLSTPCSCQDGDTRTCFLHGEVA